MVVLEYSGVELRRKRGPPYAGSWDALLGKIHDDNYNSITTNASDDPKDFLRFVKTETGIACLISECAEILASRACIDGRGHRSRARRDDGSEGELGVSEQ